MYMKEIFHNYDNLEKEEITETVTRVKSLLINDNNICIIKKKCKVLLLLQLLVT